MRTSTWPFHFDPPHAVANTPPTLEVLEAPTTARVGELVVVRLRVTDPDTPFRPLDSGCASFVQQTADIPADKIMRLRANRGLYGPPPPYSGRGRPRVHGEKFKLSNPDTWWEPDECLEVQDSSLGRVQPSLWRQLHFKQAALHALIVVRIHQLDARGTRRDPKVLWLVWVGAELPALHPGWRLYLRRFALEHWYRFAKQRLYWTLPHFGTPEQAERWSDLLPLITWELWLARQVVADQPLPWQKPQENLSPGRVCQSMGGVLAAIGTPAGVPKPRGKSPGWPKGRPRQRRPRYPVVKKGQQRRKKAT